MRQRLQLGVRINPKSLVLFGCEQALDAQNLGIAADCKQGLTCLESGWVKARLAGKT